MNNLFQIFKYILNHPLGRKHKIKAISNFVRWQFGQLFLPYAVEYPFIGNTRLLIKKGMKGATGNIYVGLQEFNDMGFMLHFLREEDLFIDVGANIGSYTILASGYIGAKSISMEPVPQTFELLRKNVLLNNLGSKSKLLNCGVGAVNGKLFFTSDHDVLNHVVMASESSAENLVEVDINSLDNILSAEDVPPLIKIDVEGFEQEVINGAQKLLQIEKLKAIIIELNGCGARYGYNEENIHRQLLTFGFKTYTYDPLARKLNEVSNFGNHNTIYIRDLNFVEDRIKSASSIKVFSEIF